MDILMLLIGFAVGLYLPAPFETAVRGAFARLWERIMKDTP